MVDGLIAVRRRSGKLSPDQRNEASRRFAAGESARSLGEEYGVTARAVRGNARRRGIRFIGRTSRRHTINEDAFAEITPESAYWIGFLMADGNVSKNVIQLRLSERDLAHIEKFRAFVGGSHAIVRQEAPCPGGGVKVSYIFGVHSKKMSADLAQYGVVPRKSVVGTCRHLTHNRDYWRGMIDGDGGLFVRKDSLSTRAIFLCGGKKLMEQYQEFVRSVVPSASAKICKNNTVCSVWAYNRNAIALAHHLYYKCCVSLDRKFDKYTEHFTYHLLQSA